MKINYFHSLISETFVQVGYVPIKVYMVQQHICALLIEC